MNLMEFNKVNSALTRFNKFDGKVQIIKYCMEEIHRGKLSCPQFRMIYTETRDVKSKEDPLI